MRRFCRRRIDGRWAMIHRPVTTLGAHMWISYSPDLAALGKPQGDSGSAPGRLVGCKQDWTVLTADRDCKGVAHNLPRRAPDGVRQASIVSDWRSSIWNGRSLPPTGRLLDVWTGGALRARRRCEGCGVSLRADYRPRRRHDSSLLRRGRFQHGSGHGQHSLPAVMA